MIDFTVKTLDSRNHSFSVADDITVKQVKDVIAESISIPPETQRLIYCGEVLQDEKNLKDYNVHGKVIHLVQRAPPQTTRSNVGSSGYRQNQQRRWTTNRQNDGNSRYLGTLAIPAELLDTHGVPIIQPSHILTRNRLNVARRMIRYMDYLCNRLENPSSENDSPDVESPDEINSRNDVPNEGTQASNQAPSATNVENNQTNNTEQTSTSTENASGPSNNTNTNASGSSETRNEPLGPRPADMADVMASLMRVRDRADVHMRRCMQLLRDDPEFASRAESDEAKRIFIGVTFLMHHMAHACHALSDIVWVPSTNRPRTLHSYPAHGDYSALLTGIPIQGQINVLLNRHGSNSQQNPNASTNNTSSNESHTGPSESGPTQTATETPSSADNTSNDSTQTGTNMPQVETGARSFSLVPANLEFIMEVGPSSITIDALEATVVTNGSGNGSNGNGESNVSANFPWGSPPPQEFIQNLMQAVAGHMMNRSPSSTTSTTTTTTSVSSGSTTSSTNGSSGSGGSQTSQARGNTATHPTTSTQTRSTSRPHVHFAMQAAAAAHTAAHTAAQVAAAAAAAAATAASGSSSSGGSSGAGLGSPSNTYDPFLPCNSIHLHAARRSRQSAQHQQQGHEEPPQQEQSSQESASSGRENAPSSGTQNNSQNASSNPPIGSLFNLIQSLIGTGATTIGSDNPGSGIPRVVGMVNLPGNPSINVLNLSSGPFSSSDIGSIPVLAHLLQGISEGLGGVGGSNGNTIADLFENLPDHSYTEGESVFADLVMTLARGLTLQDVLALCLGVSTPLNNLRPQLAQFVRQRLLQNQPTSETLYRSAADRINSELRPYLDMLSDARLREDIDLVGSITRCNIERLPQAMRMILDDASEPSTEPFGARLLTWCQQYGAELCRLALHCSLDGARGLEPVIHRYVQQLTTGVHPTLQLWTSTSSITHVRNYFQRVINQQVDYERYLVYRAVAPPTPSEQLTATTASNSTSTTTSTSNVVLPDPEPMDTELTPPPMLSPPSSPPRAAPQEPVQVRTLSPDPERLPDVIIGSESWHHALPQDWVPIIARDTQRQQRQRRTAAVALSDAYLAGMPTKRRKEVLANRPNSTETGSPSEDTEPMSEDPPAHSSEPPPGARF